MTTPNRTALNDSETKSVVISPIISPDLESGTGGPDSPSIRSGTVLDFPSFCPTLKAGIEL